MKKPNYTAGPWFVSEDGFSSRGPCPTVYATDDELRYVAFCNDRINMVPTPNLANAKLIAAAPRIAEVLNDIVTNGAGTIVIENARQALLAAGYTED